MEIETKNTAPKKASWEKMKTANVLAVIITLFCGAYLVMLSFIEIPDKNRDLVIFLAGLFFGMLAALGHYFFNYKKKDAFDFENDENCFRCGKPLNNYLNE